MEAAEGVETVIHVGFTGTRNGMSSRQRDTVSALLRRLEPRRGGLYLVGHHGDCAGADAEFHDMLRTMSHTFVIGHPPHDPRLRAHCQFDEERPPKGYLTRNRDIVDEADVMIATPYEAVRQARGGTWYTIDYAVELGRPLAIVLPDGEAVYEGAFPVP